VQQDQQDHEDARDDEHDGYGGGHAPSLAENARRTALGRPSRRPP
jgi:hypothetical protein